MPGFRFEAPRTTRTVHRDAFDLYLALEHPRVNDVQVVPLRVEHLRACHNQRDTAPFHMNANNPAYVHRVERFVVGMHVRGRSTAGA